MRGTSGTVYNAGSGQSVSIGELLATINTVLRQEKPVASRNELRPNEVLDVVADISRARRELNWAPRISLSDGLRETIASMRVEVAASL
jgi:nucleoside-diphosphate-sugar epimerase